MRTRLIDALCVMLLAPLPLFLEFADVARWARYIATGNEAPVWLPPGETIVPFSPLSFGVIAAAFLAVWGITLLLMRWLNSKDRLPSALRFLLFWGLLGALWTALASSDELSAAPPEILWAVLKFGLGTLIAATVAALLSRLTRPRASPAQA